MPTEYGNLSHTYDEIDALPEALAAVAAAREETDAALADLIDSGGKNILNWTAESSVMTIVDNGDGTFTASGSPAAVQSVKLMEVYGHAGQKLYLSGCPSGGSQASGYSLLIANQAGTLIGPDEGSGFEFTAPENETFFRVYARFRPGTYNNLLFKPMVCLQSAAKISKKFVKYCPTLAEIYAMIQS